jgi:hypothetical protein
MRHCAGSRSTSGQDGTLPSTNAAPVRNSGGTWPSDTASAASDAHSAIAPSA